MKRERRCWWCSSKLSSVSHAEIKDRDGNTVLVHKVCEPSAREFTRGLTADCPPDGRYVYTDTSTIAISDDTAGEAT